MRYGLFGLYPLLWLVSIIVTPILAARSNRSIIGWLICALFFGPIALLIIALLTKYPPEKTQPGKLNTLADAQRELNSIKELFLSLKSRIEDLENRIAQLARVTPEVGVGEVSESKPESAPLPLPAEESLEFRLGKYWLSRLGIISFVFAVVFFIAYSFRYLGPWAKLFIGYLISLGLLTVGWRLEQNKTYQWFCRVIFGGGWGLLYFTVFAMYHIPATKVITSEIGELFCLGLVSVCAIIFALRYKSWQAVSLAYLLGYLTVATSDINYFTFTYYMFLIASLVFLVWKMRWEKLLLFGIIATFFAHLFWVKPQLDLSKIISLATTVPLYKFRLSFIMLCCYWAFFTLGIFLLAGEDKTKQRTLVISSIFNASFYLTLGLWEIYRAWPHFPLGLNYKFNFVISVASVYLLFTLIWRLLQNKNQLLTNAAMAISAFTMAIPLRAQTSWISAFWLIEICILVGLGVFYQQFIFRWLASVLATIVFFRLLCVDYDCTTNLIWGIQHNIFIFGLGTICFYLAASLMEKLLPKKEPWCAFDRLFINLYVLAGTLFLTMILGEEVKANWLSTVWALEGIFVFVLGFLLQGRIFRISGFLVLALAVGRVLFHDLVGINTIYRIAALFVLGLVSLLISLGYAKFKTR